MFWICHLQVITDRCFSYCWAVLHKAKDMAASHTAREELGRHKKQKVLGLALDCHCFITTLFYNIQPCLQFS